MMWWQLNRDKGNGGINYTVVSRKEHTACAKVLGLTNPSHTGWTAGDLVWLELSERRLDVVGTLVWLWEDEGSLKKDSQTHDLSCCSLLLTDHDWMSKGTWWPFLIKISRMAVWQCENDHTREAKMELKRTANHQGWKWASLWLSGVSVGPRPRTGQDSVETSMGPLSGFAKNQFPWIVSRIYSVRYVL